MAADERLRCYEIKEDAILGTLDTALDLTNNIKAAYFEADETERRLLNQAFARGLGVDWAGGSDERPPEELDAAIVFAPVGSLMVEALKASAKGGRVVSAGIHMSDIPSFPYAELWGERSLSSVANLTREDGREFLELAPKVPVHTSVTGYPLERANEALDDIRSGRLEGAAVLRVA